MSNVKEFTKMYPTDTTLEDVYAAIDLLDVSNIEKLDLKQKAKEAKKDKSKNSIFRLDPNVEVMEDTYLDELIEGWGRGA